VAWSCGGIVKELHLWIYTASVVGQSRVLLVADMTVGGAKDRFSSQFGTPGLKNAMPASTPGFPTWLKDPGVWISIAPLDGDNHTFHKGGVEVRGLDRWSQEMKALVPDVLPEDEVAYVHGPRVNEAKEALEKLIQETLEAAFPAIPLKQALEKAS